MGFFWEQVLEPFSYTFEDFDPVFGVERPLVILCDIDLADCNLFVTVEQVVVFHDSVYLGLDFVANSFESLPELGINVAALVSQSEPEHRVAAQYLL